MGTTIEELETRREGARLGGGDGVFTTGDAADFHARSMHA